LVCVQLDLAGQRVARGVRCLHRGACKGVKASARIKGGQALATGVAVVCLSLTGQAASAATGTGPWVQRPGEALPAQVRLTGAFRRIPGSFLGLSVEARELLSYVQDGSAFDRAVSLLRPASGAPVTLRVGGKSADDAYWDTPVSGAPSWVFEIGDDWLTPLAALAQRDRLRVTLDVNLAAHSPSMAANLAEAAFRALAPDGLAGLAIGNEPDLFRGQPGLDGERIASTTRWTPPGWTLDYSPLDYRRDYIAYARALSRAAPGVPLAGPETSVSTPAWFHALTGIGRLGPRDLTIHRYPLSLCWPKSSRRYPRISSLLSERASAGLADGLRRTVAIAHDAGMSLQVSEINSVSCGGNPGVADSFATALWAPDVLFELIRVGVDGVNWHIRAHMLNAPFELTGDAIEPLPELYGLALFDQMIGPNARSEDVRISSTGGLHLKAWAVSSPKQTSVLLINKGPWAASVSLIAPTNAESARVERLSAPSIGSTTGVTLTGRWIGSDGRWHGHEVAPVIRPSRGRYHLRVPGYSAALVQAALR
jgi:hypothetical protein